MDLGFGKDLPDVFPLKAGLAEDDEGSARWIISPVSSECPDKESPGLAG